MSAMNAIEILTADRDEWKKRAIASEAKAMRLQSSVEQSVVLYEILRKEDEAQGDVQGENFWEGHRDTAMHALGTLQSAHAEVDRVLGSVPQSGTEKDGGNG